jgi:hypothetical protein
MFECYSKESTTSATEIVGTFHQMKVFMTITVTTQNLFTNK